MKKINLLIGVIATIIFLFGACKPKQISLNVVNLNKARGVRNYSTIYSLPKTVIRVNLKVQKNTYRKGPYQRHAKSYLGLGNAISEDREYWKITGVEFETYAIVDTNQIYLIETNNELNRIELELTNCGLLKTVYPEVLNNNLAINIDEYKSIPMLGKGALKSYKLDGNEDINFDDVPLPNSVVTKRTEREQAFELSKKIHALRDDRAAILVGDGYTETMPDGGALKIMIEKIDLIQNQYISMFKGKVKKESFIYSFDYIPDEPRKITQSILFRFSHDNGIVENTDMSGMPMIIEIESYENLKNYTIFTKNQTYLKRTAKVKEEANGLYYRIPEMGIVRLLANEDILMQEKVQISQFGSIHSLPVKYLDGKHVVNFYPELGSLKSIKRINKSTISNKK